MYDEIRKIIQKSKYEIFGIRRDNTEYKFGDTLPNSHQLFQDPQYVDFTCTELLYPYIEDGAYEGYYDGGELNGTSAIYVDKDKIKESMEDVKSYNGKYLYLIAGNDYSEGNDINEIIIENAKVIKILEMK